MSGNEDTRGGGAGGSAAGDASADSNTTISNSNNNDSNNNNNSNNSDKNANSTRSAYYRFNTKRPTASESKDFSGSMDKFKNILAMSYEQDLENKTSVDDFTRNFINHVACNSSKYGIEMSDFLTTGVQPSKVYPMPNDTTKESDLTYMKKKQLDHAYELHMATQPGGKLDSAIKGLYNMVWGQCTSALQGAIARREDYETKKNEKDVHWLLENLKEELSGVDSSANPYSMWWAALRKFVNMRQGSEESANDFLKRQNEYLERFEMVGGTDFFFSEKIAKQSVLVSTKTFIQEQKEKFLAVHLVEQADAIKCKDLWKSLVDGINLGRDEYPESRTAALNLLMKHTKETKTLTDVTYDRATGGGRGQGRGRGPTGRGRGRGGRYQFHGRGTGRGGRGGRGRDEDVPPLCDHVAGTDGVVHEGKQCFRCWLYGHYSDKCPDPNSNGSTGEQPSSHFHGMLNNLTLTQNKNDLEMLMHGMLLDTGATDSGVNNPNLVDDIRMLPKHKQIVVQSNGGTMRYDKDAQLKLFPIRVYYNPSSAANILSFGELEEIPGLFITYDGRVEKSFLIHYNGAIFRFRKCSERLYFFNGIVTADSTKSKDISNSTLHQSFIQTVAENKQTYSQDEIKGADFARKQQRQMMFPSDSSFKHIIANNWTNHNKVTLDDISNGLDIYGTQRQLCEGKMTRPPSSKAIFERVSIPQHIKERFADGVHLEFDIIFANRLPFVHSRSQNVTFRTIQRIKSRAASYIKNTCKKVVEVYKRRGFKVTDFHGDNEFDLEGLPELLGAEGHFCAADEHVGGIERQARTIKERSRCSCHDAPYRFVPKIMTESLLKGSVKWLNIFPSKGGVSQTLSPSAIIEGKPKPDMSYDRPIMWGYYMVFIQSSNGMKARSVPGIALEEANDRGSYYFMNLYTKAKVHSKKWHEYLWMMMSLQG